jgi:hypothetical protein
MLSRRSFGKLSLAASASCMAGNIDVLAEKTEMPRFDFEHGWGELPQGLRYGTTHGIAIDKDDFVYIAHTGNADSSVKDCILVFAPDGSFEHSFGAMFAGGAHGLDIFTESDGSQVLFLTDLTKGLFKMSLQGELIWHVAKPKFHDGKDLKYRPSNVAAAADGTVFLSDGYGSYFIHVFDREGNELDAFAGHGVHEKGKAFHPHGLWIDVRPGKLPLLILAENYYGPAIPDQGVLQRFTLDGKFHSYIDTAHELMAPRHLASHGQLLAIPDLNGRVTLLDGDNQLIGHIGDIELPRPTIRKLRTENPSKFPDGKFICPHDGAFDSNGNLFVAEWVPQGRITKLKRTA